MSRVHVFSTLTAALIACAHSAHANLLDDGSFTLATPGGQVSNSDWDLTVNLPDGMGSTAQFQGGFANAENGSGGPGDGGNGIWFKSFEGNQGNSGDALADARIDQSIVAPITSDYLLTFVAGREANFTAQAFFASLSSSGTGGTETVDLLNAPMLLGNIGGAASPALGGNPFSLLLTGVTAGDTLTVAAEMVDGMDSQLAGGQSAFVDAFELTAVPEPSTMILGMAGMLGVGWVARRRK